MRIYTEYTDALVQLKTKITLTLSNKIMYIIHFIHEIETNCTSLTTTCIYSAFLTLAESCIRFQLALYSLICSNAVAQFLRRLHDLRKKIMPVVTP